MTGPLPIDSPVVSSETTEFWSATGESRLLLRRCDACEDFIWYPRAYCPACGSQHTSWVQASGKGMIYTFTVVHRSMLAGFREALPYVIAYVELDEGPRVLTNIIECDPTALKIGMPVCVVFHDTGAGNALFRFRPA